MCGDKYLSIYAIKIITFEREYFPHNYSYALTCIIKKWHIIRNNERFDIENKKIQSESSYLIFISICWMLVFWCDNTSFEIFNAICNATLSFRTCKGWSTNLRLQATHILGSKNCISRHIFTTYAFFNLSF